MHPLFIIAIIIAFLPAIPTLLAISQYAIRPLFSFVHEVTVLAILTLITVALAMIVRILHLLLVAIDNRTFTNPVVHGDGHDNGSDGNDGTGNGSERPSSSDHSGSRPGSSHGGSSSLTSENSNILRGQGAGRDGVGLPRATNPAITITSEDGGSSEASSDTPGGGVILRNGHNPVPPMNAPEPPASDSGTSGTSGSGEVRDVPLPNPAGDGPPQ